MNSSSQLLPRQRTPREMHDLYLEYLEARRPIVARLMRLHSIACPRYLVNTADGTFEKLDDGFTPWMKNEEAILVRMLTDLWTSYGLHS